MIHISTTFHTFSPRLTHASNGQRVDAIFPQKKEHVSPINSPTDFYEWKIPLKPFHSNKACILNDYVYVM